MSLIALILKFIIQLRFPSHYILYFLNHDRIFRPDPLIDCKPDALFTFDKPLAFFTFDNPDALIIFFSNIF